MTVDLIHQFFAYFFKKKYANTDFIFKKTDTTIKHAETFISLLNKKYGNSVNEEFLFRYFVFQFQYWDEIKFTGNTFNNKILISFVIGKKAFERYLNRKEEYDWQLDKLPVTSKYGILKSDLIKSKVKIAKSKIIDTEAPIKLANFNTEVGFLNCIDYSTLYNHRSKICAECKFQKNCKKLLQKIYPGIYIDRGY